MLYGDIIEGFLKVLGIAFVFFVAFFIIGVGSDGNINPLGKDYASYESSGDYIYSDLTKVVVFKDRIGSVGNVKEAQRVMDLGSFSVGYNLGEDVLADEDVVWIQNGLFVSKVYSRGFEVLNPKMAVLRFYVNDSNGYGRLIVEVNGKEVYSNYSLGWVEIQIYDFKEGYNEINIYAESSGMRMWAPTTYQLLNLELVVNDFKDNRVKIPFVVEDYEFNGWRNGFLSFYVTDSKPSRDLKVLINDVPVYSGRPYASDEPIKVDVSKYEDNLRMGENFVEFYVDSEDRDSYYDINSVLLKFFFYGSDNYLEAVRTFDISSRRMLFLSKENFTARLYVYASSVLVDNGISVELNGHEYSNRKFGNKGYIIYDVDPNLLRNEDNYIKIKTAGAYNIDKVELVFERA